MPKPNFYGFLVSSFDSVGKHMVISLLKIKPRKLIVFIFLISQQR